MSESRRRTAQFNYGLFIPIPLQVISRLIGRRTSISTIEGTLGDSLEVINAGREPPGK